jgi:hypothetical protein
VVGSKSRLYYIFVSLTTWDGYELFYRCHSGDHPELGCSNDTLPTEAGSLAFLVNSEYPLFEVFHFGGGNLYSCVLFTQLQVFGSILHISRVNYCLPVHCGARY